MKCGCKHTRLSNRWTRLPKPRWAGTKRGVRRWLQAGDALFYFYENNLVFIHAHKTSKIVVDSNFDTPLYLLSNLSGISL